MALAAVVDQIIKLLCKIYISVQEMDLQMAKFRASQMQTSFRNRDDIMSVCAEQLPAKLCVQTD
jgi:hypothetical protein